MKRLLILIPVLLLLNACDEDPQVQELKSITAEQRQQVDRLLESHQTAVSQLSVQLNRQAQAEAAQHVAVRSHELSTATMIVLGCSLAVTFTMLLRRRGQNANQPRT